jgi:hypothetical protein
MESRVTAVESSTPEPISTLCLDCGYVLDHLAEPRCPECGRPFDPRDPSTFTTPAEYFKWRRWAQPPPMWIVGITGCLGAMFVLQASTLTTAEACFSVCATVIVSIALLGDYALRVVAVCSARKNPMGSPPANERPPWRWIVMPAVLALVLSAFITRWPMHVRFEMSRPAFEAVVRELENGTRTQVGRQRIGWYRVDGVMDYARGGACYFVLGFGLVTADEVGFVYDPSGRPSPAARQLAPGWCTFEP